MISRDITAMTDAEAVGYTVQVLAALVDRRDHPDRNHSIMAEVAWDHARDLVDQARKAGWVT